MFPEKLCNYCLIKQRHILAFLILSSLQEEMVIISILDLPNTLQYKNDLWPLQWEAFILSLLAAVVWYLVGGSSPEATKLPFVSPITFLVLLMSCHWKNIFLFTFVSVKSFGSPPEYLLDPLRYKHCCCWNKSNSMFFTTSWRYWSWHKNNSPLPSLTHVKA